MRAVLGDPSYPPRSEVDTGKVNNHHHLRLGVLELLCVPPFTYKIQHRERGRQRKDWSGRNGLKWKFAAHSGELNLWIFLEFCVVQGGISPIHLFLCTSFFNTDWHAVSIDYASEARD